MPALWPADKRVQVLGPLDGLRPLFSMVRLTVAPLRFGAGLKGKVLDSLAAGVPCAMSPIAAEELSLNGPLPQTVAADADAPAEVLLRLHDDPAFNVAYTQTGIRLVKDSYSNEQVTASMARVAPPGSAQSTTAGGDVGLARLPKISEPSYARDHAAGSDFAKTWPAACDDRCCFRPNSRRCSNKRLAGAGSSPGRRAQTCSWRRAQGSTSRTTPIAMVLLQRLAAVSGMMANPMPLPTIRQTASKLPRRTRSLRGLPA